MRIKEKTVNNITILVVAAIMVFLLFGCDVEECSRDEMYIDGYQEIVYPSGDTYLEPIWRCP